MRIELTKLILVSTRITYKPPGTCIYVYYTVYMFFLLVLFVPYHLAILLFFIRLIILFLWLLSLGWRFFVVLSYPVTLDLRTLISVLLFSVSVCDHIICISLG